MGARKLTLLSRTYCHLCEDMLAALHPLQGHQNGLPAFEITVIDIDQQPSLEAIYGDKVPVLLEGEIEICHYFLDEKRLRLQLAKTPVQALDQLK